MAPAGEGRRIRAELALLHRHRTRLHGSRRAHAALRRDVMAFALHAVGRFVNRSREVVVDDVWRELVHSIRRLRRAPAFSLTVVATLALGIGANALIFSVVDGVVFRPLPYPQTDRLVAVWGNQGLTLGELEGIRERSATLAGVGGWRAGMGVNLETEGDPLRASAALVSPEVPEILGIRPELGGLLPRESSEPGRDDVALLAHDFWVGRFGADSSVVGTALPVDGRQVRVAGVLPEGVEMPWGRAEIVLPLVVDRSQPGPLWGSGGIGGAGLLAPGATPEEAQDELRRIADELRLVNPVWTPREGFRDEASVVPLRDAMVGDVRTPLLVLLAAVTVVLLVVCANVANLVFARSLARRGEVALRAALGAGRARLAGSRVLETLILAGVGGGLGVLLARWGLQVLHPYLPADLPRAEAVGMDGRVLAFTLAVAAAVGVVTGLVGVLRSAVGRPAAALKSARAGSGKERRRVLRALVMGQVAAAVVLVSAAGLLVRSLGALRAVDPGFDPAGLVTARVDLSPGSYPGPTERAAFARALAAELEAVPELGAVALAGTVPFGATREVYATAMDGVTDDPAGLPSLHHYRVTPGYFRVMGIPVLEGRAFETSDDADGELVALVDRTAAERFWPGESPLGRIVRYPWQGAPAMRVVGVVGPVAARDVAEPPPPTFYVPLAQNPSLQVTVVGRAASDPAAARAALGVAASRVDPRVPVSGQLGYESLVGRSLAEARLLALLLGLFAATALLLGGVGVYGVVAHSVRDRMRDIGVRMALGARAAEIRRQVWGEVAWLTVPGLGLGLAMVPLAGRLLRGLLFGVAALDPVTLVAVPVLLALTVAVAVAAPTLAASRIDPATVLREG